MVEVTATSDVKTAVQDMKEREKSRKHNINEEIKYFFK